MCQLRIVFYSLQLFVFTVLIVFPLRALTMTGLFLIAVGSGGIKACDAAFGGDQFKLPQQQEQMDSYFSNFYICINIGMFLALFIVPAFRDTNCFDDYDCYPLAFLISAVTMVAATSRCSTLAFIKIHVYYKDLFSHSDARETFVYNSKAEVQCGGGIFHLYLGTVKQVKRP